MGLGAYRKKERERELWAEKKINHELRAKRTLDAKKKSPPYKVIRRLKVGHDSPTSSLRLPSELDSLTDVQRSTMIALKLSRTSHKAKTESN